MPYSSQIEVDPRAVVALPGDQLVADRRIPAAPVLAAGVPHGLHGVVVAVEIVLSRLDTPRAAGIPSGSQPLVDFRAFVDAGAIQGHDAGGRAGEPLCPPATMYMNPPSAFWLRLT